MVWQVKEIASSVAIAAAGFTALFGGFTRRSVLALAKMPLFADLQFQSFGASLAEAAAGVSVLAQVIAKGL
jgi:hypothetical protein